MPSLYFIGRFHRFWFSLREWENLLSVASCDFRADSPMPSSPTPENSTKWFVFLSCRLKCKPQFTVVNILKIKWHGWGPGTGIINSSLPAGEWEGGGSSHSFRENPTAVNRTSASRWQKYIGKRRGVPSDGAQHPFREYGDMISRDTC